MMKRKYLWILFSLVFFAACSDLEDTYSDYAGDGEIRYLGQCTGFTVTPGWEKLNLKWTNSVDPVIANIRVTWELNDELEEVLLPPTTTEYTIEGLVDGSYEVTLCGVDDEGNTSLVSTLYGRPYTSSHEMVQNFSQMVSKHFYVKDRMVLFFSPWSSNIVEAHLTYTKADMSEGRLALDSALVTDNPYYLLEDAIAENLLVSVVRTGILEGDTVELAPVELTRNVVFTNDFKTLLRARFGTEDLTAQQLESINEFDIDYSLNSFEDILYMPNLKRLNLGKNRFLKEQYLSTNQNASVLMEDQERSLFALEVAHELLGTEAYRYNQHFLPNVTLPYLHQEGNPVPEQHTFLPVAEYDCTPADDLGFDSHLEQLFDGNPLTAWEPAQGSTWREHIITVGLDDSPLVHGIQFTQKSFDWMDSDDKAFAPVSVKVQVSEDGAVWENATHLEEITLGNTGGEITLVDFPEAKNVNFIRFTFNDQIYGNNFSTQMAEISIY